MPGGLAGDEGQALAERAEAVVLTIPGPFGEDDQWALALRQNAGAGPQRLAVGDFTVDAVAADAIDAPTEDPALAEHVVGDKVVEEGPDFEAQQG